MIKRNIIEVLRWILRFHGVFHIGHVFLLILDSVFYICFLFQLINLGILVNNIRPINTVVVDRVTFQELRS